MNFVDPAARRSNVVDLFVAVKVCILQYIFFYNILYSISNNDNNIMYDIRSMRLSKVREIKLLPCPLFCSDHTCLCLLKNTN